MQLRNALYQMGYVPAEKRAVTPVPKWAKDLVPMPEGTNQTILDGSEDTERDTMPLIKNKIYRTLSHTKKLAPKLKGSSLVDTTRNDWNFIFKHIKYVKDDPGMEQIRSPRRLIHDGKGDCDCFTVTLSSLLLNQGIPHFLRIMKEAEEWSHIYIVVPKDGNVKKKLTSRDQYIVLDCVTHKFDFEPPHKTFKDFPMALQYLDGVGQAKACPTKPIAERLKRYVYTEQVLEQGLVPTKQFLEANNIPALPQSDGSLMVSTPSGMKSIPSIITKEQAAELAGEVKTGEAAELITTTELVKAEAGLAPKDANWLWYLLIGSMGAVLLFAEDPNAPKKKEDGAKLSGYKPKSKKKLKTLRI